MAERGHTVAGTIQDLGVSASVSPFDRPDLGPWLTEEKAHEWDVLVFSKLVRLFRSTRDFVKFAEWAEQHGKMLVFAEDGLTLNYRGDRDKTSVDAMMAELFVYLGSFFAQLKLNRFKSRALDGHRVLRQTDRWASGVPPIGFRVVDHPSGKGKGLATDPEGKELLYGMAGKLLDGWSFIRIAAWLNDTGAQTNMNRAMIAKGKDPDEKGQRTYRQGGAEASTVDGFHRHRCFDFSTHSRAEDAQGARRSSMGTESRSSWRRRRSTPISGSRSKTLPRYGSSINEPRPTP